MSFINCLIQIASLKLKYLLYIMLYKIMLQEDEVSVIYYALEDNVTIDTIFAKK